MVTVVALLAASSAGTQSVKEGGAFRVAVPVGSFGGIDPALNFDSRLLGPACGALIGHPDKPLPEGLRLRPELAQSDPVLSRDGRTYTFTIRRDARFSTGSPVTARAFARALERILDPAMQSDAAMGFQDIVGAQKMLAGKGTPLAGVVAKGRTLTVRLRKRVPAFLFSMSGLCAVPPGLPADPEGAKAPLPSAAPYYVSEYVPNERLVLERNRFYRGERPRHVDRFVADLGADSGAIVDEIASGKVDFGELRATDAAERSTELARRYGVNRSQFFVVPGAGLRIFVLNTSRPLLRNNVKLRQAINFAVDRRALTRELGAYVGRATDQYLIPVMPGFRSARIYPLGGPDLRTAKKLATGRTRSGKAVLYAPNLPLPTATAQILQQDLKAIGLDVEIRQFPAPVHFAKLATPGEPFDIGYIGWFGEAVDPSFLNFLFDGRTIGQQGFGNFSYFDSPKYNRLLERASRLTGDWRYRAYGALDVQLSRDAAPAIPFAAINAGTFVSSRVGCVVVNPWLDLTAVCLK